jgi:outer membrane receptor protein involved in Fe transport
MAALAGGVSGLALAYAHPAAAQQADQPVAQGGGGLDQIVVAARPNDVPSVELLNGPRDTPSGPPTNSGATMAEPKTPTGGIEGFIQGGVGSYGGRALGGAATIPLVQGKLLLQVGGYESHSGAR